MKILFFLPIILLAACGAKENQTNDITDSSPWSIEEPQIANKKGKIFLTNVQHQSKAPLQLTDSLLFDTNENTINMTFTTLSRCYDADQKELIETKTFSFQSKINIQKLMPKEAFHPRYIIQKQTLNCTFKFTVQKEDGSSHNFRLYSQSVDVSEQVENNLITLAGENTSEIKVLNKNDLNQEHFIIPDLDVGNLELVCQSFSAKYLSQKNILNPFFGFNVKSIEDTTYPREMCRIIGNKNGEYILSKPFQLEFHQLKINFKVNSLEYKYDYQNKSLAVAEIVIENKNKHSLFSTISFPNEIMINKIGTNYSTSLEISYQNTEIIEKVNDSVYRLNLKPNQSAVFRVFTNLTRQCFTVLSIGLGQSVINDLTADVYFPPGSIILNHEWHPNFYYKNSISNDKYLSVNIANRIINHPLFTKQESKNKVNENYTPHNTNGCLSSPPKVHTVSGQISPF